MLLSSFKRLYHREIKEKVAIIGSGNWSSAIAGIIGENVLKHSSQFKKDVQMWVYEEKCVYNNKDMFLTDIINEYHENIKYLPNIKLPSNIKANNNLADVVNDATMLVFCTPHQFIADICDEIKPKLREKENVKAISLIKGMDVTAERDFNLISNLISKKLGIDCSVMMGANIANEVAKKEFSESTIGYENSVENANLFYQIFNTSYFNVTVVNDIIGVELCGTLKNIIAIGVGLVDGVEFGNNTKAAIIRLGLLEMIKLSQKLYPNVQTNTFLESCGVADLITTCFGGRNRKVAEAYAQANGNKSFDQLEEELLNGQKLQGVLTSNEVQLILNRYKIENEFPLFTTINQIINGHLQPQDIIKFASVKMN